MTLTAFCLLIFSYLAGAVPFGLLLSRSSGIDIRSSGSGNIGATNVSRLLGRKLGVLTLLMDIAKGYLPMFLAARLLPPAPQRDILIGMCGVAAVIGHMYPIYLKFKGGKGVATGLGVFLYLSPLSLLFSLVVFLAAVGLSGFVSLGSLLASAAIPLWLLLLGAPGWKVVLAIFISAMIWFKHTPNIKRLISGTEKSWKKGKNS